MAWLLWKRTCWQILKFHKSLHLTEPRGRERTAFVSSHWFNGTTWGTWARLEPSGLQQNQTSFHYLTVTSKNLSGGDAFCLWYLLAVIKDNTVYSSDAFSVNKGAAIDSNQISVLSNTANISFWFASCSFCERTGGGGESDVRIQPWLCKQRNKEIGSDQDTWPFSRQSAIASVFQPITRQGVRTQGRMGMSSLVSLSCQWAPMFFGVEPFERSLRGGMYLFDCWHQISTNFLQNRWLLL